MPGRNEPCPCGSGKKYKKCCLPKEKAARAATATNSTPLEQGDGLAFEDEEVKEPRLFPTGLEPPSYSDPLIEQFNIFWDAFESSSYEEKWSLVADKLHESPEMFDAETVFEVGNALFSEAAQAGDIDRFNQLLDTFQDRVPDAYAYELGYVLEWRTFGALISGNTAAVEKYFHEFTPIAGQELDTYYRLLRALAYHGELSILLDGMRQARPFVEEYPALVEWAYSEFSELLGTYELLHLLDKNPELAADDPTLLERFEEYELTIQKDAFKLNLDYRTGRKTPDLDVDGFALLAEVGPRDDQAREYLTYLLSAFTRYAHVEEGISPTKTEMARDELYRYFVSRSAGDLGPYSSRGRRGKRRAKKHRKKPTTGQHPLCPDPKTLDRFLGEMFGFMSVRHYQASAMFELIPVWLRFLEKYDLVDEEIQKGTLKELSYLGNHLVQYLEANDFDPLPRQNLEEWPAPVTHMQTS